MKILKALTSTGELNHPPASPFVVQQLTSDGRDAGLWSQQWRRYTRAFKVIRPGGNRSALVPALV